MKEPNFYNPESGLLVPYSQAPIDWLVTVGDPTYELPRGAHPESEHWDGDFRRRYAAILLQERGRS